jgi:acetyl esterase/lipase
MRVMPDRSHALPTSLLLPAAAIASFFGMLLCCGQTAAAWPAAEGVNGNPGGFCFREDPRPAVDVPSGLEESSSGGRRLSRRARRLSRRQGLPFESEDMAPASSSPAGLGIFPLATAAELARQPTVVHRNQPYGADDRQRFDLFLPGGCSGGGLPLVVWFVGDDWQSGDRSGCPITWLVSEGYAVASVSFRPASGVVFPGQLDDCLAAVAALRNAAELWGIDRDRICVVGRGGGGHLATLMGLVPESRSQARVAGVCAIAAPSHLPSLGPSHDRSSSPASRLVGGPLPEVREAALRASPLTYVSTDDPPVLLLHGLQQGNVPVEQSERLHDALRAAGVDATLVLLDEPADGELGRGGTAGRNLLAFLDRTLGPGIRLSSPDDNR